MQIELAGASFTAFLLAMTRIVAWLSIAPPFNTRLIPMQVRLGLAAALSLSTAPKLVTTSPPTTTPALVAAIVTQVAAGLALGFFTMLLISAVQAAGSAIDLFAGYTLSQVLDPVSGAGASVFGRLYQIVGTTLLFATGGHLILVRGLLRSFDAVPLGNLANIEARLLTAHLATFMIAALEIAAPVLAALFLAEVALGLLTRAAPQLNPLQLGLPLKAMLALGLTGLALPLLPTVLSNLLHDVLRASRVLGSP